MKKFKPSKKEINNWVDNTICFLLDTFAEGRQAKIEQLKENVEMWKNQLETKTEADFNAPFPVGEANRQLKTKYEAGLIVLKKLKLEIKSNQYGFPGKTYYYIQNGLDEIYHHKDRCWRKNELKEITTYFYLTESAVKKQLENLPHDKS